MVSLGCLGMSILGATLSLVGAGDLSYVGRVLTFSEAVRFLRWEDRSLFAA